RPPRASRSPRAGPREDAGPPASAGPVLFDCLSTARGGAPPWRGGHEGRAHPPDREGGGARRLPPEPVGGPGAQARARRKALPAGRGLPALRRVLRGARDPRARARLARAAAAPLVPVVAGEGQRLRAGRRAAARADLRVPLHALRP